MTFKHLIYLISCFFSFSVQAQISLDHLNTTPKCRKWADKTIPRLDLSLSRHTDLTDILLFERVLSKQIVTWTQPQSFVLDYDRMPNKAQFDAAFSFTVENGKPIREIKFMLGNQVIESFPVLNKSSTRGFEITQKPYHVTAILPCRDTTITATIALIIDSGTITESRPITLRGRNRVGRLALVLGNAQYKKLSDTLKNAVNDAVDMATTLRELGFNVIEVLNGDRLSMARSIADFSDSLKNYETGLVYYAGHGVQHKGENYLIPIDCDFKEGSNIETTLKYGTIPLSYLMDYVEEAHANVNIFILDACRTNPIGRAMRVSNNEGALIPTASPFGGSIIAYSAGSNQIASDQNSENDRNGLYTHSLLKFIKNCSLTVQDVFQAVRADILSKTKMNTQLPVETNMLTTHPHFCPK